MLLLLLLHAGGRFGYTYKHRASNMGTGTLGDRQGASLAANLLKVPPAVGFPSTTGAS